MSLFEIQALGTHWSIQSLGNDINQEDADAITAYIRDFEARYSRFKPDSLLSQLNDHKVLTNPPQEMVAMARYALDMYGHTEGLFNMSVGAKLEQLGYGRQADSDAHISEDLQQDISISNKQLSIKPHIRLDFGGFGKGWLVDALGNLLKTRVHNGYIINGGGDILVESNEPQTIVVEHPFDPTLGIGEVTITRGGIASSSGQKRVWKTGSGQSVHHILDPSSGEPGGTAASVLVCASNALLADTLGTVMLLATPAKRQQLADRFEAPYLVIGQDLTYHMSAGFPGVMNS
jgi:FAD:protein FMN transferase